MRGSLFESSAVPGEHEQLVPYEVQDQELAFVQLPIASAIGSSPLATPSGIKAEGEDAWNARKHGGCKKRLWRKLHPGMDEETLEIRALSVTTSNVAPSRQIASQSPAGQWMGPMTRADAIM